jgi:hypothetical protein
LGGSARHSRFRIGRLKVGSTRRTVRPGVGVVRHAEKVLGGFSVVGKSGICRLEDGFDVVNGRFDGSETLGVGKSRESGAMGKGFKDVFELSVDELFCGIERGSLGE